MPKRYDRCVKDVSKKISTGKIPKTYVKGRMRKKSNPYAICSRLRAKGKVKKVPKKKSLFGWKFVEGFEL